LAIDETGSSLPAKYKNQPQKILTSDFRR